MDLLNRLEQGQGGDGDAQSQRRFRRFSIRGDALLEPLVPHDAEKPRTVMLRDISRGGAGFLCSAFLEPGSMWRLRFHSRTQHLGAQPVIIRFCRLIQQDLYLIGGQYIIEPSLLAALGVTEAELTQAEPNLTNEDDVSEFHAPESLIE